MRGPVAPVGRRHSHTATPRFTCRRAATRSRAGFPSADAVDSTAFRSLVSVSAIRSAPSAPQRRKVAFSGSSPVVAEQACDGDLSVLGKVCVRQRQNGIGTFRPRRSRSPGLPGDCLQEFGKAAESGSPPACRSSAGTEVLFGSASHQPPLWEGVNVKHFACVVPSYL